MVPTRNAMVSVLDVYHFTRIWFIFCVSTDYVVSIYYNNFNSASHPEQGYM